MGWETKTLPELIVPGKHSLKRGPFGGALKKEIFVDSGYLVYEQNHALNNDYSFGRYFITEEKYKELIAFKVQPNDILISCSGVYLGKLSIVPSGAKPGIINQALLKVCLDQEQVETVFFTCVFGSAQFKKKHFPSIRGVAIPNLPPMNVMKRITGNRNNAPACRRASSRPPHPPAPLRRHRRIHRAAEGPPPRPPGRVGRPLCLAPIPRLQRRTLSDHDRRRFQCRQPQ